MSKIVLCDIDGTIANNDHRQHYLEGKKDWEGFFSEIINDSPIIPVIQKINEEFKKGNNIIFVTGRPERYRYSTNLWLKENFFFDYELLMRKNGDQRNKEIVKNEIFQKYLKAKDIILCIDNDKSLLKQWNELGLKTLNPEEIIKRHS